MRTLAVSEMFQFDTRDAASAASAARLAGHIGAQLDREGDATVVVSGGTTPQTCFEYLSDYELCWESVRIALSDERWVDNCHADSNEAMVRTALLRNKAAAAELLSIYQGDMTVDERCDGLQKVLPAAGFAAALVGMGKDGHFASLFPDAASTPPGLDLGNQRVYLPVTTVASPHPRISMTLAALLRAREVIVLIFGKEKRAVAEAAASRDDRYPVTHLFAQRQTPVSIFWAP